MERDRLFLEERLFLLIARHPRLCHEFTQRAYRFTRRVSPEEAVLLAGITPEFLRISEYPVTIPVLQHILALSLDIGAADQYGSELIFAYPAVQDLFFARFGIKEPLAIRFYQGDRERPVLVAYGNDHL